MSAKSCEIARKFIGIRAIRGVLHGVTGSSEAKSLYDEWLNRGHGVKNGRLDSLRGGLTLFLCPSLDLDGFSVSITITCLKPCKTTIKDGYIFGYIIYPILGQIDVIISWSMCPYG